MIEIWLDTHLPPTGNVVIAPGRDPQPFDGWLQLLHILGGVIGPQPTSASGPMAGQPGVGALVEGGADQGHADEHE